MPHTTYPSSTRAAGPLTLDRTARAALPPTPGPLLQTRAHWSLPAHRSYLHAANFQWQN